MRIKEEILSRQKNSQQEMLNIHLKVFVGMFGFFVLAIRINYNIKKHIKTRVWGNKNTLFIMMGNVGYNVDLSTGRSAYCSFAYDDFPTRSILPLSLLT